MKGTKKARASTFALTSLSLLCKLQVGFAQVLCNLLIKDRGPGSCTGVVGIYSVAIGARVYQARKGKILRATKNVITTKIQSVANSAL